MSDSVARFFSRIVKIIPPQRGVAPLGGAIAQLRTGQGVTIVGECDGAGPLDEVILKRCRLEN